MASALWSGRVRWLQLVSRTKPRAELWSPPEPVIELKLTTSGWAAKYFCTCAITACSRALDEPGGNVICTEIAPWSSLGKNDVGRRKNSTAMPAQISTYTSIMRLPRRTTVPTPRW